MNVELFEEELKLLGTGEIYKFTVDVLNNIPEGNFKKWSSSTGKYHPKDEADDYGNLRHTKKVVKIVSVMLSSRNDLNEFLRGCTISAAILHDALKYGMDPDNQKHTLKEHATLISDYLLMRYKTYPMSLVAEVVSKIVKSHNGQWDDKHVWIIKDTSYIPLLEVRDCQLILHYADMVASRSWYGTTDIML